MCNLSWRHPANLAIFLRWKPWFWPLLRTCQNTFWVDRSDKSGFCSFHYRLKVLVVKGWYTWYSDLQRPSTFFPSTLPARKCVGPKIFSWNKRLYVDGADRLTSLNYHFKYWCLHKSILFWSFYRWKRQNLDQLSIVEFYDCQRLQKTRT